MSASSKLFTPIQIGDITVSHRIVLAPLTRCRADMTSQPSDHSAEYYSQRSTTPGTFLITEATVIAPAAGGLPNVPGIYSEKQIEAWKKVADAVHANGCSIYMQLWAIGRTAVKQMLQMYGKDVVSSGDIICPSTRGGISQPRPLTKAEIDEFVALYAQAAKNAVLAAGFDGVEIHAAHGYLIDQFTQDTCNNRTDEYGGSIENRSRFCLEVLAAVVAAVGESKVALRLSPWTNYMGMRMEDPIPPFTYLVNQVKERHPRLAYLHLIEPHMSGEGEEVLGLPDTDSNDFIRELWAPKPLISAGGWSPAKAWECCTKRDNELCAFGRQFIANPDLPKRIFFNVELNKYDRPTFYSPGVKGYTDYPFDESIQSKSIEASA